MPAADDAIVESVREADRARRNLAGLQAHLGADFDRLVPALARQLPRTADPDMALNNLERLFAQPAARPHVKELLAARGRGLEAALHLLAASQFFADTLAAYPELLEAIRSPQRRSPTVVELAAELRSAMDAAADDAGVLRAIRRFRARHQLRIGVSDILRDRPLEEVAKELSRLADAAVEAALAFALRAAIQRSGKPMTAEGKPASLTAFAFGKLGGDELNYSSDIDLLFVYDHDGETAGKRTGLSNAEFFAEVIRTVVRLLSQDTDRGIAYRVDLRLRPEGQRGPLVRSLAGTLSYYDTRGRTWERQALIKLRPVAGDPGLGREFLAAIEPFIYRKYFSFAEINEVKALKRQMEARAGRPREGGDGSTPWNVPGDVKTGRGGIRDIEYTVQFLQLLNGGDLQAVRQRNTLLALEALEISGCLTPQETYTLADAYRFLRKTEHRLQLLFDLQTHKLPASSDEMRKLALRMGYREETRIADRGTPDPEEIPSSEFRVPSSELFPQRRSPLDESPPPILDTRDLLVDPLDRFLSDLHDKTAINRAVLNHLLHQTFPDADAAAEPETDLILDPDPEDATVQAVLGRYGFRDAGKAYQNLTQLARESVPFLSDRRCRHFLASIAPPLLRAVAETPNPDDALTNLERVSASLGAKAVLWELLSVNPASLKLYVELCSGSPFLSGILTNNPGMADELLDSLVLNRPRSREELQAELAELCRGASDLDPILHSFQDKELVRIGVADLLGLADIRQTTLGLSDVADALLNQVVELVEPKIREKWGVPTASGEPCRYAILGFGKLGGREISYHSDLDLLLVYEADGETSTSATTNAYYFTELAQRVIRMLSAIGPMGRLYSVDMRLRPTGKSGTLVLPLSEFDRYFATGTAQLWERQALGRARVIRGDAAFGEAVMERVHAALLGESASPRLANEVRRMREKLEASASPRSLKRGRGGLTDVEFLVQLLQIECGREHPDILRANVWEALDAIAAAGLLPLEDVAALRNGYSFLRLVEARLRIVTDRPLTEVPDNPADLAKLARRLGFDSPERFLAELRDVRAAIRAIYDRHTGERSAPPRG
ncbi:MAG TPA: bifunctional [glutamate--ammonia ligase]-adenylyl-L-tyrosine phosphorylase/[glutamate--ammonia-ligase] adenylyltransferase [Urbifossiella sp.]|nr:bifunctional [glutamate--ammonia ligase]-adenylyl-L-tyrosine phosphorylase/[glutamate--ammonia-ligase] adenylyltransferase [Urbifossiella sp.]